LDGCTNHGRETTGVSAGIEPREAKAPGTAKADIIDSSRGLRFNS
jgi:hypothetical protein